MHCVALGDGGRRRRRNPLRVIYCLRHRAAAQLVELERGARGAAVAAATITLALVMARNQEAVHCAAPRQSSVVEELARHRCSLPVSFATACIAVNVPRAT